MKKIKVRVCNEHGIHARPATQICKITNRFEGDVFFEYKNAKYNAKNVMAIMLIGLSLGEEFYIIADGKDENILLETLKDLIEIKQFKQGDKK